MTPPSQKGAGLSPAPHGALAGRTAKSAGATRLYLFELLGIGGRLCGCFRLG